MQVAGIGLGARPIGREEVPAGPRHLGGVEHCWGVSHVVGALADTLSSLSTRVSESDNFRILGQPGTCWRERCSSGMLYRGDFPAS